MAISSPYGTWRSPLTPEMMTGRTVGLSSLAADGSRLFWLETRPEEAGRSTLMCWSAAAGAAELTPAPADIGSRVHEYGGGAFVAGDGHVVFSERRSGEVRLVTPDGDTRVIAAVPGCRYADFALDLQRNRVLAVREDHRDRPPTDPETTIVALDLSGTRPAGDNPGESLVATADFLAAPRLSRDGALLAWLEWDHPDMPWDATRLEIAALDAAGRPGPARPIAGGAGESVLQPEWSADGSLLFISDRSGWWNLHRWQDGASTPVCPMAAEIGGPAWQLATRHHAELADGRIVVALVEAGIRRAALIDRGVLRMLPLDRVAQCPVPFGDGLAALTNPSDTPAAIIRLSAVDSGETTVLRTAGPPLLDPEDVSPAEPLDFPTGDGVEGHAFHYRPRNKEYLPPPDEAAPPLVVLCHGGPTAMTGTGFSLAIQWWTTRGFAVLDVNYRGSTGYGRPYRALLEGRWGIADVEDCIAGAEALARQGLADPARIAIRGGSAGGFTVLAALTMSRVFKAGASLYGIADLALLAADTHKFESRYLDRLIGPLPAAASIYRERSPLYRLERLDAPVIFFQGMEDRVVPPNQAETIVDALTRSGLPVAYYPFEGEGHGFRRAETIKRVLTLELGFYGRIFGFTPPDLAEAVTIRNLAPDA
jgi:acetyl esterase/lipase